MGFRGSAALWLCAAACIASAVPRAVQAQGQVAPSNSPSVANPATSVIGWFQGVAGNDSTTQNDAFLLREAEIGFQAAVDPFTRADFFLSAGPEGLDVEEGYIIWLALPGNAQAKVGKFRADLGKFNRTHPPETPFADRPLSTVAFLGDEGLSTTGIALSTIVPNPLDLYWDLTANLGTPPDSVTGPLFQPDSRSDLLALGRTSVFVPLGESADLNLGVSYANALANPALRGEGNRAQVAVGDVTLHWKNPRRSIYRSLLAQAEVTAEQGSDPAARRRSGRFGYVVYQFARQWKMGARWDWTEAPGSSAHESGALALLIWQPSEFSTLSLQGRRVSGLDGASHDAAFFKWTFNIGPHGAHPY
jgi:hypothetical protein